MPAGSDPVAAPPLPHTWRPLGPRVAAVVLGAVLVGFAAATWYAFDPETRSKFTPFQRGTLVFLGLLIFGSMYALARSRVVAEAGRLVVVNGYRRRELDWAQVVAARLPPGAPWVTLDLSDGTTVPAMGIQGSDGGRAQRAVRELRVLLDQHSGASGR